MRAAAVAALALACCGRIDFDPATNGSGDGGAPGGDGAASVCPAQPTSGSCGATPPFSRVQVVPANCPYVGPSDNGCEIIEQLAGSAQPITQTAGDLLVAFAYAGQNPLGTPGGTAPNLTFSISDTLGDTFFAGPYINNATYNDSALQIFYAPNIAGGANAVTVTENAIGAGQPWTGLVLFEYAGLATTDVADAATTYAPAAGANTTQATTSALVPRTECDLFVGGMTNGHEHGEGDPAGTGWEEPVADTFCPAAFVDNPSTGTSYGTPLALDIHFGMWNDDGWAAAQMAFRASGTTAPCQPDSLAFTAAPATVAVGACSSALTIETQRGGVAMPTSTGATLQYIVGGSVAYSFFADAACMFPVSQLEIGAGTASTTFYMSDGAVGQTTLGFSATGLTAATTTVTVQ